MSSKTPIRTRTVSIIYNGDSGEFPYAAHQPVRALLKHALGAFHITANRHLMSLYDADGTELIDQSTLEMAGVKAGDELVLRQSVVKGG
jgi:hypothetical protein